MTSNDDYELTRRDAIAALAAVGVAGGAAFAVSTGDEAETDGESTTSTGDEPPFGPIEESHLGTLTAAADVLYPSEVDGVAEFVTDFVRGRAVDQPDHAAGIADAATYVDEWSRSWLDEDFAALDPDEREEALDRMGLRDAEPDPEGSDRERVRYYVVNELLFALYASPTGGKLVGIENPQGYPGGTESYRRGPQ